VVPASGNPWIAGQRIGLGPALSGRAVVLSVGLDHVHVYLDGHWIKTLPSRLDRTDIARLLTAGTRPARQPAQEPASNSVIDLERAVNASGNANLGGHVISAGIPLAQQRVNLRLDGPVAHILSGGVLARTVTCPVPEQNLRRLRGARPGQVAPPQLPEAQIVKRRVSVRRAIMVGRQRIRFWSRMPARPPRSPSVRTPTALPSTTRHGGDHARDAPAGHLDSTPPASHCTTVVADVLAT
jgi:hypothetical protein